MGISEKMGLYHADLGKILEKDYQYKAALEQYQEAYAFTNDPEHLFFMARTSDLYYKDKRIAQKYYKK